MCSWRLTIYLFIHWLYYMNKSKHWLWNYHPTTCSSNSDGNIFHKTLYQTTKISIFSSRLCKTTLHFISLSTVLKITYKQYPSKHDGEHSIMQWQYYRTKVHTKLGVFLLFKYCQDIQKCFSKILCSIQIQIYRGRKLNNTQKNEKNTLY